MASLSDMPPRSTPAICANEPMPPKMPLVATETSGAICTSAVYSLGVLNATTKATTNAIQQLYIILFLFCQSSLKRLMMSVSFMSEEVG